MGLFGDQKKAARKRMDADEWQRKAKRQWDKVDLDADEWQKRARRQWDHVDLDTDELQKKVKDLQKELRRAYHRDEPESSSAGFIAGVAVGVLLGAVLAYLFGKQGGSEMVDQFAHRAEGLKETATEKFHDVRDRPEPEAERATGSFDERVDGGETVDDAKAHVEDAANRAADGADDVKNRPASA